MRGLPAIGSAEAFRVRRWDVVMLGSALPGLVAATRLGQAGLRVLVLEEAAAREAGDWLREPWLLVDAEAQSVLSECLRTLGLPLIDQRRFVPEEVALQVCDSEARIDWGRGTHTAEEWTSWGLATKEQARSWLQALDEAAESERSALLESRLALRATRRARDALAAPLRHASARGWPRALQDASPALRSLLEAPLRALSNLGEQRPSPEARARLLGGLLRGGVAVSGEEGGLRRLLRRRIESLYGEFRTLDGDFRLVAVAHQPGLALAEGKEIWSGRALVLNAPIAALADVAEDPPDWLRAPPIRWRRHTLHYRGPREQLSPCMADRVVWRDRDDGESVALRVFRGRRPSDGFDLIASAVVPRGDAEARKSAEERIERALRDLLPFSEGALERRPLPEARWDDDTLLADPAAGAWPREPDLRVSSKPPIYGLERAAVGGLGGEGELWLGWRAGDAIAEELA